MMISACTHLQSVVLSGGYEDDRDEGEWFLYTGSGGKDLSGNKRTNKVRKLIFFMSFQFFVACCTSKDLSGNNATQQCGLLRACAPSSCPTLDSALQQKRCPLLFVVSVQEHTSD